jgi:hypothetical protein
MKKIMVGLAALALLAVVVPQAEAAPRHHRSSHGYAISARHGYYRPVVRHRYHRRAYYDPYYSGYYSPYYGGYSPYYGFPGISLSFGGGHHSGGHHGHH